MVFFRYLPVIKPAQRSPKPTHRVNSVFKIEKKILVLSCWLPQSSYLAVGCLFSHKTIHQIFF